MICLENPKQFMCFVLQIRELSKLYKKHIKINRLHLFKKKKGNSVRNIMEEKILLMKAKNNRIPGKNSIRKSTRRGIKTLPKNTRDLNK